MTQKLKKMINSFREFSFVSLFFFLTICNYIWYYHVLYVKNSFDLFKVQKRNTSIITPIIVKSDYIADNYSH